MCTWSTKLKGAGWNGWGNRLPPIRICNSIQWLVAIVGGAILRRSAVMLSGNARQRSFNAINRRRLLLSRSLIFNPQRARRIQAEQFRSAATDLAIQFRSTRLAVAGFVVEHLSNAR